jgi:glutamate formiminotransferase/formiminotetrahydrofolate cyclodeaminase
MVLGVSLRSKKLAAHHDRFREVVQEAHTLRATLQSAIEEDARAFDDYLRARRLPEGSDAEKNSRAGAIRKATLGAALVPMNVVRASVRTLELLREIASHSSPAAASDVGVGVKAAVTAVDGAGYNVRINLKGMEADPDARALGEELRTLASRAQELAADALREVEARL